MKKLPGLKEFLEYDNSYLTVPRKTNNIFSKSFWKEAKDEPIKIVGSIGNQREAYEDGFSNGWDLGKQYASSLKTNINPVSPLSLTEYSNICKLLEAIGIDFVWYQDSEWTKDSGYHPGLNVVKNLNKEVNRDEAIDSLLNFLIKKNK